MKRIPYFSNVKFQKLFILILISLLFLGCEEDNLIESASVGLKNEIKGIDASFIPELRERQIMIYNEGSNEVDILDLLQSQGFNTIRMRLWHSPIGKHSAFDEVKSFSDEVKSRNLKTFLNFHYSDTWADPGKQASPQAWNNLSFNQVEDSMFVYTKSVILELQPDYVQIGNEINNGFVYPFGKKENLEDMKSLLNASIQAIREASPLSEIIIHYAGIDGAPLFFEKMNDLDYDIIALSYYPYWHGKDLNRLETTLNTLTRLYSKKIIIAEIAYPFTSLDGTENFLVDGFPASSEGQLDFVKTVKSIIDENSMGYGICLWGGVTNAYAQPKPSSNGYYWENQAVLDYDNHPLPILSIFNN